MLTLEEAQRISLAAREAAAARNWTIAEQKARTAMLFKRPTKALEDAVLQGRSVMMTLPDAICLEGGLPLMRDGVEVGAIGVSGMKSSEDGIVAEAGALALAA